MLKPKYVHGLNADEASKSLLSRLRYEKALEGGPIPPNPDDDLADGLALPWAPIFG